MAEPGPIARALAWPLMVAIWGYRVTLSPLLGGQCRFDPTCSRYALAALKNQGAWHGLRLTLIRLSRCHPLSRGGYDPAPAPGEAPVPFRTLDIEPDGADGATPPRKDGERP